MTRGLLLLALAAAVACDAPAGEEGTIDRERFVATLVDLRRAITDDRFDDAVRDSILASHDVTAEELRAYVSAHAEDPAAYADTWREINETLTAPPDTATADSAGVDSLTTDSDTSRAPE